MRLTSLKNHLMDDWVDTALTDDDMVVELLLRLKHAETVKSEKPSANLPPLRWGIRQRRSRPSRLGVGIGVGVGGYLKKDTDSAARASPTTPLCWSGGSGSRGSGSGGSASPSAATADGFEDTSRQTSCSTSTGSGSKAINEFTSSCSKRSKKKKTFFELKDVEHLHLKERLNLEKKIANVQATYVEQSAKNQSLKRIKFGYSDRVKTDLSSRSNLKESSHKRRKTKQHEFDEKSFFFVPDLNMTPTEEDETLYGTS